MVLKGLIPSSLYIENGLTYKSVDINLENQGLVFVRGINHDTDQQRSNGSGKSSFADILEHVLFDSTSRGLDKDEIIRAGSSEGYYAKLCLKTPSGVYYIEQARKHSKHGTLLRIFQQFPHGVEEISVPKNINKTKQQIQTQILKMTKQQFHGSVYLSQEAGFPLVSGTGSEVSKYLSSTFGFDIYDDMRSKVKATMDQLQSRVTQADVYVTTIRDIDSKLSEFKDIDYIVEMEKAMNEYLDYGQDQLSWLYDQNTVLAKEKSLVERRERLISSLTFTQPLNVLQSTLEKKKRLHSTLHTQLVDVSSQKTLYASYKLERERLETKESELRTLLKDKPPFIPDDLSSLSDVLEDRSNKFQHLTSFLEQWDNLISKKVEAPDGFYDADVLQKHLSSIASFDGEAQSLLLEASRYESLKQALDSTLCPTCGQEVPTSESRSALEEAVLSSAKAKKQYNALLKNKQISEKYVQQHTSYSNYLNTVEILKSKLQSIVPVEFPSDPEGSYVMVKKNFDIKAYKQELSYLSKLQKLYSEVCLLRNSIEEKDTSSFEDVDFDTVLSSIQERLLSIQKEIDVLSHDIHSVYEISLIPDTLNSVLNVKSEILSQDISALKSAIKNAQGILNKFSSDAAVIRDLTARKIKSSTQLAQFTDDIKQLEWLKSLYKALAKLKARKLHSVVESIRDVLPSYIGTMFDGEDISFEINDEDPESVLLWASRPHPERSGERVWLPVRGLSKGERAGLRVSLLWTLKDITQPEKSVDLLILDEADDGLDETGLAAFCSLLEKIRSQYGTVIVISQRKELTGVKFDHIWTAVKKDGITTLNMN